MGQRRRGQDLLPALEAFEEHRPAWDELNRLNGDHPLLDSAFVAALLRHFGDDLVRLGLWGGPEHWGMALLVRRGPGLWETFQPSQAPLGLILLAARARAAEQARELLRWLPGYGLGLSALQQDPAWSALGEVPTSPTTGLLDYIETARLNVSGPFEAYWKSRGRNLVHNLTRQERRLTEQGGTLELAVDRAPATVAAAIQEYGRLESQGWKAAEGTAVTGDNPQGRFYREVLEHFCALGEGVVYRLVANGNTVAADLCVERNGMLVILKTAYDESVSGLSPGLLLHQKVFQQVFADQRVKVVEFYGRVREWHLKWTDDVRTMRHVTVYRHRWVPSLRRLALRLRALRRAT